MGRAPPAPPKRKAGVGRGGRGGAASSGGSGGGGGRGAASGSRASGSRASGGASAELRAGVLGLDRLPDRDPQPLPPIPPPVFDGGEGSEDDDAVAHAEPAAEAAAAAVARVDSAAGPGTPPTAARGSRGSVPGVRHDRSYLKPVEREIRDLQSQHKFLSFPKVSFARLVRDIQVQFSAEPYRWTPEALFLFQTAAEEYLMYLYADAYLATIHRQRVTLNTEDIRLVRRLRQPHCWGETL